MDLQDADKLLATLRNFVEFHSTITIMGAWLFVYGLDRLVAVWRSWSWLPWAKSKGVTQPMVQRFNLVLVLFLPLTIFGGVLNLIKPVPELSNYYNAYRPLHALIATVCAGLIIFNFGQMVTRAVEQGKTTRLWRRLSYSYDAIADRGVALVPLIATPVVFFLPAEELIGWARELLVAL
jgi:branched-subunit amino acid ABC-type transport system permease component